MSGNLDRSTVLVTGANGFIGRVLCEKMLLEGWQVRGAVRTVRGETVVPKGVAAIQVGAIGHDTDWSRALPGVDVVIHLAARVHVMKDSALDPLSEYRYVNVEGTKRLALMASRAGVKRFIYMSTIKVNGEQTQSKAFTEYDTPSPQDPYSLSKWEAEKALKQLSFNTEMTVTVIRPPLVYGTGVKGNFLKLLGLICIGIPLPLNSVENRRSYISIKNLADLICLCTTMPEAKGETFLVSDGEDVSTPELIRRVGAALDRPARLFSFPRVFLRAGAGLLGKNDMLDRLCGSLVVNSSKARRLLKWTPSVSMDEGLSQMARWYLEERVKRNV